MPGVNVSGRETGWENDDRVPDVTMALAEGRVRDRGTHWYGGPDFLVDVVSPDDQTRRKLPFYARIGVSEALVIDRQPWSVELFRCDENVTEPAARSAVEGGEVVVSAVLPLSFRLADAAPPWKRAAGLVRSAAALRPALALLPGDPGFEFLPVDVGQLLHIGPEGFGTPDVDVLDLLLRQISVPVDQHPDAAGQPALHHHFVAAEQGDVEPAELAGGQRGEFGVKIGGGGEHRTGNIRRFDAIAADHQGQ